jgi:segregation and condensation protein B
MDYSEIEGAIEGILFASGDPVSVTRLSAALGIESEEIREAASRLTDYYSYNMRGIRLIRLEDSYQLCSAPKFADVIRLTLETRKPPQLSPPALEVLATVAYFQPVTRAYIEKVRGVDSSYTVGILTERGLIEPCGRLAVPGRPIIYRTTKEFLRTFGISSLDELPVLPDDDTEVEGQLQIQNAIEELQEAAKEAGSDGP